MPLFTQFSCFLRLTSLGTSFLLQMSLPLNVVDYYREDTTSVSYFCLITRPLFKPIHPYTHVLLSRNTPKYHVTRIVHGFGTNECSFFVIF